MLDYYRCFVDGLASGQVDYNQRRRDPLIETDRLYAREKIEEIIAALRALSLTDDATTLLVRTEDGGANSSAWCNSSVLREIEFLQSHTIHHYSLIAMLLRSYAIEPDEEFGVAPSTLRYWKEEVVCAR